MEGKQGQGSCSELENGVYLAQPEADNINNKVHYIKQADGMTRHLFYDPHVNSGAWAVAPVGGTSKGVLIQSRGAVKVLSLSPSLSMFAYLN